MGLSVAAKEKKVKYIKKYKHENIDQLMVELPKGKKQVIRDTATAHKTSMNKLVVTALEVQYDIDLKRE